MQLLYLKDDSLNEVHYYLYLWMSKANNNLSNNVRFVVATVCESTELTMCNGGVILSSFNDK